MGNRMIPQRFSQANKVFTGPKDMPSCADVHAYMNDIVIDDVKRPVIITCWRPTPKELVLLNLGEPVYLSFYQNFLPPHSVQVESPWVEPPGEKCVMLDL